MGGQRNTPHRNRSRIGAMHPVQYLQDGRFARPVAAKKGVNFAGQNREIHVVQGFDTAKSLGNALHDDGCHWPTASHRPVSPERSSASATSSQAKPSAKLGLGCLPVAMASKKSWHSTILVSE